MALRIVHGLVVVLTIAMLAAFDEASAGPPTEQLRAHKIIQASGYQSLASKLTEKQEPGAEADREPAIRKASQAK